MDKSCDILILGGGGAGLAAAARAASISKAKIIVVEKADWLGGGAIQAADFRVYNSKWQKERGLDDAMERDLLKYMDETNWLLDSKLVGNTFKATGKFFDWLCTFEEGVADNYEPGRYIFDMPDQGPVIPAYKSKGGGPGGMRGGTYATKLLIKKAEELGVEMLLSHKTTDIDVDNGKITGITVESEDGMYRISCKAFILATGSWINNQDILERVDPVYAAIDPGPLAKGGHRSRAYTGDGIAIAEKAGAFIDYESFVLRLMGPLTMAPGKVLSAMSNHPYSLQINLSGRRWICEPSQARMGLFKSGHQLARQPGGISFVLFDKNTVEKAARYAKDNPPEGYGGFFGHPTFPDDIEADIEATLSGKVESPFEGGGPGGAPMPAMNSLVSAATIAELAEKMGVPKAALEETISHYNDCCAEGFDDEYFKPSKNLVPLTGPYYALRCTLGTDGAFGGVLVNADMQAYAKGNEDKPEGLIDGMYVIGDFASGRFINDLGFKNQIINDLSWAYASGYIAAESAVKYLGL